MFTLIGLGNIGSKYKFTRHNVGWIIFDNLFSHLSWQKNKYAESEIANTRINDTDVLLVRPETFMNESGRILPYLIKTYGTMTEKLVVVHDDIDLPMGEIKISHDRGDGGHNGVKSIMNNLGTKEFIRIRVGVSIKGEDGVLHKPDVLGNFSKEEIEKIKSIAKKVSDVMQTICISGYQKAMTLYN